MSGTSNYASTPLVGAQTMTLADAVTAAPANAVTLVAPGVGGAQVERIVVTPLGTVIASVIRIWLYDGAVYHLLFELPLAAYTNLLTTARGTVTAEAVTYPNLFPIIIPPNWSLRASMNDAQAGGVKIIATGGGY
jgi:hypothetical protein